MFTKKILSLTSILILFFVGISSVFSANYWFKLDSVDKDKAKFSWDETEKAPYKQISYWTKSSSDWTHSEETDLFEWTSYTISWLKANTTYYFSLVWINSDWEKIFTSNEVKAEIWDTWEEKIFKLEKVEQIEKNKLKLKFSNKLAKEQKISNLNFKIESILDENIYLLVSNWEVDEEDSKNLILTLNEAAKIWTEYKVVVLSILDEDGNTIKYWVDSEQVFKWENTDKKENTNTIKKDDNMWLNSAWPSKKEEKKEEVKKEKKVVVSVKWKDVKEKDIKKDVNLASKKKEDLPKTWPELLILFIIALALGWLFFFPKYMKKS